jgi:hypothetical protein
LSPSLLVCTGWDDERAAIAATRRSAARAKARRRRLWRAKRPLGGRKALLGKVWPTGVMSRSLSSAYGGERRLYGSVPAVLILVGSYCASDARPQHVTAGKHPSGNAFETFRQGPT